MEEVRTKIAAGMAMPERVDMAEVRVVGPASPEISAALELNLAEAEACTFDQRRSLRFWSDQLLYEVWPTAADDLDGYQPGAPEDFDSPYLGITYIREMSDGRVGAVYLFDGPAPSPVEPQFYLFTYHDGTFALDEVPAIDYFETEMSGTTPVSGP